MEGHGDDQDAPSPKRNHVVIEKTPQMQCWKSGGHQYPFRTWTSLTDSEQDESNKILAFLVQLKKAEG
jgi:hypothetical protein